MLRAHDVSFRYAQGPPILDLVSLAVAPGEIVGLPGPSGRGKTTLGRILCGYLRPQAGTVTLNGRPLPQSGYYPVQLIFQHPELAMNPRCRIGTILNEATSCSDHILQSLGIRGSWLERYPHELSGGELQRIALARVMNDTTQYLVADEITAMLDANTQAHIWQVLLHWAQEHKVGIVAISHDMHLLHRVAGRIENRFADSNCQPQRSL